MPRVKKGINHKERQILEIIKNYKEPITSNEIMKIAPELNKNAVQPALRTLLSMELIEVVDVIMEKNVASRRFKMTENAPKIIGELFLDEFKSLKRLAGSEELFAALITTKKSDKSGKENIEELKKIIEEF
jgi:chromosome segregation and condensation protein ScpB